jgi:hypothetical protein
VYDLYYVQNQSLWLDLKIIALTVCAVLIPGKHLHERWLKGLPPRPPPLG